MTADGEAVYEFVMPVEAGLNTRNINTAAFQPGLYMLQVITSEKIDRMRPLQNR